jgi:hypothetical protein
MEYIWVQKEAGSMRGGNKFIVFGSIVLLALILQAAFVIADRKDLPHDTAVKFAKAFFMLDKDMSAYLCKEITAEEGGNAVDEYLWRIAEKARAEGFQPSYMKMVLSHIETITRMVDDNTAEVHLTCLRRRSINPVFAMVGKLFFLSETYPVDETLTVVKEDKRWKVCGQPFSLVGS